MSLESIGSPRSARTLRRAGAAQHCAVAVILLAVSRARGAGAADVLAGPLDQLNAGDACIHSKDGGSICRVPEDRLDGFEAYPPGRGRFLLAGGTKKDVKGPKLGVAECSVASSLVLPNYINAKVFQPTKGQPRPRLHLLAAELLPVIPTGQVHLVTYDATTERLRRQSDDVLAALLGGDVDPSTRRPPWVLVEYETLLALVAPYKVPKKGEFPLLTSLVYSDTDRSLAPVVAERAVASRRPRAGDQPDPRVAAFLTALAGHAASADLHLLVDRIAHELNIARRWQRGANPEKVRAVARELSVKLHVTSPMAAPGAAPSPAAVAPAAPAQPGSPPLIYRFKFLRQGGTLRTDDGGAVHLYVRKGSVTDSRKKKGDAFGYPVHVVDAGHGYRDLPQQLRQSAEAHALAFEQTWGDADNFFDFASDLLRRVELYFHSRGKLRVRRTCRCNTASEAKRLEEDWHNKFSDSLDAALTVPSRAQDALHKLVGGARQQQVWGLPFKVVLNSKEVRARRWEKTKHLEEYEGYDSRGGTMAFFHPRHVLSDWVAPNIAHADALTPLLAVAYVLLPLDGWPAPFDALPSPACTPLFQRLQRVEDTAVYGLVRGWIEKHLAAESFNWENDVGDISLTTGYETRHPACGGRPILWARVRFAASSPAGDVPEQQLLSRARKLASTLALARYETVRRFGGHPAYNANCFSAGDALQQQRVSDPFYEKGQRSALEFRCQVFRHLEKVLHHSMSVALARGDDDMGFADFFSEIRRITTHDRPNELAWDVQRP